MGDVATGRDDGAGRYEICVAGHLAPRWSAWFDGMTVARRDDGTTVIHGTVADQSALHGLLRRVSDLGLTLVSVKPEAAEDQQSAPPTPAGRPAPGSAKARSRT